MVMENSYDQCLKTMFGLRRFGIKLGLETIGRILEGLGNPQEKFPSIHVAGSNGKGSIASALSTILRLAGLKVGLYTSPHLVKFNERICIGAKPISDERVVKSHEAVKEIHPGDREPTFFEFATAMAMHEFGRAGVDLAIIETGMGGRLDATNILKPSISIISNISLEHRMYLGNTIAEITGEKGGIIKEGIPVVTGVRQKSAISVLEKIADEKSAPFYRLGDHFRVRRSGNGAFNYYGMNQTHRGIRTGLLGKHQVDNAALVLAACEILDETGVKIPEPRVRDGLAETRWPGRLEIVSDSPMVILDGAHNLAAAHKLADFLSNDLAGRNITLVAGILDDKPHAAMMKCLLPFCRKAIITSPKINRALPPEKLYETARGIMDDVSMVLDVGDAVEQAVAAATPGDVICIAGSLYVVGEAKEALEKIMPTSGSSIQA